MSIFNSGTTGNIVYCEVNDQWCVRLERVPLDCLDGRPIPHRIEVCVFDQVNNISRSSVMATDALIAATLKLIGLRKYQSRPADVAAVVQTLREEPGTMLMRVSDFDDVAMTEWVYSVKVNDVDTDDCDLYCNDELWRTSAELDFPSLWLALAVETEAARLAYPALK